VLCLRRARMSHRVVDCGRVNRATPHALWHPFAVWLLDADTDVHLGRVLNGRGGVTNYLLQLTLSEGGGWECHRGRAEGFGRAGTGAWFDGGALMSTNSGALLDNGNLVPPVVAPNAATSGKSVPTMMVAVAPPPRFWGKK